MQYIPKYTNLHTSNLDKRRKIQRTWNFTQISIQQNKELNIVSRIQKKKKNYFKSTKNNSIITPLRLYLTVTKITRKIIDLHPGEIKIKG